MNSNSDLFLILSNVAIIPAILYSYVKRLWPETTLLTTVGIVSFLYHSCQANFYCIVRDMCPGKTKYTTLQNSDEFFVNITIIWFIMYFMRLPRNLSIAVVFAAAPVFLISIFTHGPDLLFILVGVILISGFSSIIYSILLYRHIKFSYPSAVIALIFLIIGFTIFYIGGDPDKPQNYGTYHSIWHILLMIAVFFVLKTRYGTKYVIIDTNGIRTLDEIYYENTVDTKYTFKLGI